MSYNPFENVSLDNPLPCKEVSGTYTRFEDVSESNPWPVVVIDADAYTYKEDVSEANPQPIALDTGDTYTRFEELSDANRKPVVIVEGHSYDPKQPISMTNPWPVIDASPAPSYTGPLDLVPGAVVAYGQFAASAAQCGQPYATVKESGGGTTQVFNFGSDGSAPAASITTFIGGGSGSIASWDDGSGSGKDAAQATTALQPGWLANSFNGVPSFTFSGTQLLTTASVTFGTGEFTVFAVVNATDTGNPMAVAGMNGNLYEPPDGVLSACYLYGTGVPSESTVQVYASDDQGTDNNGGSSNGVATLFGTNNLIEIAWSTAGGSIKVNGVDAGFTNGVFGTVGTMSGPLAIGNEDAVDPLGASFFTGKLAALIMYDSKLSAPNLALVSGKLASQYGITLS